MYTSQHVANYFLIKAHKEEVMLSPLKLIKLVYIGFGWVAATLGKKLFNEKIEAWKHGPVVPSLYHEFKDFGGKGIDRLALCFDLDNEEVSTPTIPEAETSLCIVLDTVWDVYSRVSAWNLRNKTHEPDTPWSKAYQEGLDAPIEYDPIKEHFTLRIEKYLDAA